MTVEISATIDSLPVYSMSLVTTFGIFDNSDETSSSQITS